MQTFIDVPKTKEMIDTERSMKEVMDEFLDNFTNAKKYKSSIGDALSLVMEFEIAVDSALLDLRFKNTRNVVNLDDLDWVKIFKQKLSKLLLAKLMIEASGLLNYEDQLITKLIEQMFNVQSKEQK